MTRRRDVHRLLRWYPSIWRERYEDEFVVFLEDRLQDSALTWRFRWSVAVAGVRERCYAAGVVGTRSSPSTQRRTGALVVLVAWSIMMIGGAALVKTAEHFRSSLPAHSTALPQFAYDATAISGMVGTLLVVAGAFFAWPGLARFVREKKSSEVRGVCVTALVATAGLVGVTFALSEWAHRLTSAQRNGTDELYSVLFLVFVLLVVATIALWTRAIVSVASRINFTARELRRESVVAIGVSLSSVVAVASTTMWWIQMALHAPWFLQGTTTGVATSPWSPILVATMSGMVLGTLVALWGALRVALSYRPAIGNAG